MKLFILSTILTCITIFLIPADAVAQKYKGKFLNELCKCTDKIDLSLEEDKIQEELNLCTKSTSILYEAEIKHYFNKQSKYKALEEYYDYLYQKLFYECKSFQAIAILIGEVKE